MAPPQRLTFYISYVPGSLGDQRVALCTVGAEQPDLKAEIDQGLPVVFMPWTKVEQGHAIVICYHNFHAGPFTERLFRSDGSLLLERSSSFNEGLTVSSFVTYPTDQPGSYSLTTTAVEGFFSLNYELIASPSSAGPIATPSAVSAGPFDPFAVGFSINRLRALGRLRDEVPSTDEAEYLYLHAFAPGESVELLFYEGCAEEEPQSPGWSASYRFTVPVTVNHQGDLFWPFSSEVKSQLRPNRWYTIAAIGAQTPAGSELSAVVDPRGKNLDETVAEYRFAGYVELSGTASTAPPPCPPYSGG